MFAGLHVDDVQFSKATGRVRQSVEALPDAEEEEEEGILVCDAQGPVVVSVTAEQFDHLTDKASPAEDVKEEADPFGLNAFLPKPSKKEERLKRKRDEEAAAKKASADAERLVAERREALTVCLKIAADRYKFPW